MFAGLEYLTYLTAEVSNVFRDLGAVPSGRSATLPYAESSPRIAAEAGQDFNKGRWAGDSGTTLDLAPTRASSRPCSKP